MDQENMSNTQQTQKTPWAVIAVIIAIVLAASVWILIGEEEPEQQVATPAPVVETKPIIEEPVEEEIIEEPTIEPEVIEEPVEPEVVLPTLAESARKKSEGEWGLLSEMISDTMLLLTFLKGTLKLHG